MKTNIFVPTKINVGYQNRSDTYTGKLAYVIYYDEKGKLRKETSWQNWRDKNIPNEEFENIPTEGFVLNKKAGGDGYYNIRQTYARVYDPRGFEFEITIPNLLWILENSDCMKGKGLVGEFVYGWDGKELVLVPVDSPDYKEITERNKVIHNNEFIKAKDLILGATYETLNGKKYVYMGKSDYYEYEHNYYHSKSNWSWDRKPEGYEYPVDDTWHIDRLEPLELEVLKSNKKSKDDQHPTLHRVNNKGKQFWFIRLPNPDSEYSWRREKEDVESFKSITRKFSHVVSTECHSKYIDFVAMLNRNQHYVPIDYEHTKTVAITFDEFAKWIGSKSHWNRHACHTVIDDRLYRIYISHDESSGKFYYEVYNYVTNKWGYGTSQERYDGRKKVFFDNLIDLYHDINPMYMIQYLTNNEELERNMDYGTEE